MEMLQRDPARGRRGLPEVDAGTIDAFLADVDRAGAVAVLLSAGDPARFPEALDVAIVLPELIAAFQNRLRGAVIARDAEAVLGARFGVRVQPSLILCRGTDVLGVIAKIQDWSVYVDRISRLIDRPIGAAATVVASIVPAHQPSGADR
ncbi:hydrogenase expression/formation protein HupG [Bradyrhizobium sp. SSBR45G]|uniref:hydrogenase accessory protein n=1 Tax=unclassified Bradyrhizobium TaxID=2631580 RepID=UPI0023429378|nr:MULTISPECIES: hydrogenase accessory protein [unclassified Bradyrhizobium]GLH82203.1 hydrogenase expression/formation protein HupG [Bradyrhizobium sp. SSBR45G]GLH89636.1 hydrogenase expression/formation protein HupG [Bradyrhizobium sp. SSBR45R]